MDPNSQLTDQEHEMLGAQQAALLQRQEEDELDNKIKQQQHMLQEEQLYEAQKEALAMTQQDMIEQEKRSHIEMQMRTVQERERSGQLHKEAELHRLQTLALMEKEQERMLPPPPQPMPPPQLPGPPPMPQMTRAPGPPPSLPGPPMQLQGGPPPPISRGPPMQPGPGGPPHIPPQGPMMGQVMEGPRPGPPGQGPHGPPGPGPHGPPGQGPHGPPGPGPHGPPGPGPHGPPGQGPHGPPGQGPHGPPGPGPHGPPGPGPHGPPGTGPHGPPGTGPPPLMGQPMQPPVSFGMPISSAGPISNAGPMGGPVPTTGGPMGGPIASAVPMGGPPRLSAPPQQGMPPALMPSSSGAPPPLMSAPVRPPTTTQAQGPGFGPPGGGGGPPPLMAVGPLVQNLAMRKGPPERMQGRPDEDMPPVSSSGPKESGNQAKPSIPQGPREIKLPQALEKVLAFKDVRAQQVGVKPEDVERVEKGEIYPEYQDEEPQRPQPTLVEETGDDEDEDMETSKDNKKESKNKRRKKKKKKARARKLMQDKPKTQPVETKVDDDIEVEYVQEQLIMDRTNPAFYEFNRIFQAFKIAEPDEGLDQKETKKEAIKTDPEVPIKARGMLDDSDDSDDDDLIKADSDDDRPKLSKKKQKKLNRLSVAELKQLVTRPDVVEMHDVTARDPKLLVHLKATRNSVGVPRHWCFKRKYLQGKRGIEKPPFDLPDFIKATGIMEMRQALQEKEDQKTMKSKMRERVRPKMGKIDIDYHKLHDAFFKWQTKPKLSIHGDLYYEGKEFETRLKEKKPGNLTDDLRTALGMPIGANADKYPPPWLIAMQRYGPPPSYPNLKVPGLNAPIPENCAFGYHAGGWGKPPVDELGKPLYGDVFGTQAAEIEAPVKEEDIDKSHWGEMESESEEEEESEEESDEEGEVDGTGLITPGDAGLVTPSGVTSVPMGVETPDMIELRKKRIEDAMDQGGDTPALYQILPEKKAAVGGAMMGSAHVYDITAVQAAVGKKLVPDKPIPAEGVEVALNPDELDLDTAAMTAKYEQTMREQQSQLEKEDLSDMVAEHAAKQQKKRKKQQQDGKTTKKYKEFKF